jgi:hypothetical protein
MSPFRQLLIFQAVVLLIFPLGTQNLGTLEGYSRHPDMGLSEDCGSQDFDFVLTPFLQDGGDCPTAQASTTSINLSTGFLPDPYIIRQNSGGPAAVQQCNLGSECRGYSTVRPNFSVVWSGHSSLRLRFFFESADDTVLIVNDPRGRWKCNDDSANTLNPTVTFDNPSPGRYDIWIASYYEGRNHSGLLYVTQRDMWPGELTRVENQTFSYRPPTWAPDEPCTNGCIKISFSHPVDPSTVKVNTTFFLNYRVNGETYYRVPGSFIWRRDYKEALFLPDERASDVLSVGGGDNIYHIITLIGTNTGSGAIATFAGEPLDGDSNGRPGGNYRATIMQIT